MDALLNIEIYLVYFTSISNHIPVHFKPLYCAYCLDNIDPNKAGTAAQEVHAMCMLGTGPCLCIINSIISELWTPDVSCQILLEIHKFVTW